MSNFTDRQTQIINAAVDLIAKGGIQDLTIKNIASTIGISEPAIYRHFQSKLEILEAIHHFMADEKRQFFSEVLSNVTPALDKITAIMEYHFGLFSKKPALAAILFSEEIFQNDRRLAEMVLNTMEQARTALLQVVTAGQAASNLRADIPAAHLVTIIMGSLRLIVNKWNLQKNKFDLTTEGRIFIESLKIIVTGK